MTRAPVDDEEFIEQLLDESGIETSEPLQKALLDMRANSAGPAAEPSAELAALMAPKVTRLRPRKTLNTTTAALALAAAAGLGVSGVAAASPQFRTAADNAIHQIAQFFDPVEGPPAERTGPGPAPHDRAAPTNEDEAQEPPPPRATTEPAPAASAVPEPPGPRKNSDTAPAKDGGNQSKDPRTVPELKFPAPARGEPNVPPVDGVPALPDAPGRTYEREAPPVLVPVPGGPERTAPSDVPAVVDVPGPADVPGHSPDRPAPLRPGWQN